MCVIIVKKQPGKLDPSIAAQALSYNPHGFGIQTLDDGTIYHTMDIKEAQDWLKSERPYVFHARLTTVGETSLENCHPVKINEHNSLFHNGTVATPHTWDKKMSDTRFVADTLRKTPWQTWKDILSLTDSRFAYTRITKAGKVYVNKVGEWHKQDGVYYSKRNVLDKPNLVAVYGTLRKGYNNHHLLHSSNMLDIGSTMDDYRMICEGIPYVLPADGSGSRIRVEVYAVDDETLDRLDMLEGHPSWYRREQVPIMLDNGVSVNAWLYINADAENQDKGIYYSDYEHYKNRLPMFRAGEPYGSSSIFDSEPEDDMFESADFIWDDNEQRWFNLKSNDYWTTEEKNNYFRSFDPDQLSLFT